MRRRLLIVLFSIGTVAGFGSGIAHLVHHARHHGCSGWHHGGDTGETRSP
jgi:hypothetical protein